MALSPKIYYLRNYCGYKKNLATEKNTAQERTRISEENANPGRPRCLEGKTPKGTQEINGSIVVATSSSGHGMKSEKRLTKPEQYTLVYNQGKTQTDRFLVLKAKLNQLEFSRFGISVSKRVGNAVIRNRVKRLLREILRLADLQPGWDIVIIARNPSAESDYRTLEKSAISLLSRAGIIH